MSEQRSPLGLIGLGVAVVGLVGFIGWDQLRQHARPAAPVAVATQVPAAAKPEPVTDENQSAAATPVPAPSDTTGESDRQQMPAGSVITI